MDVEGGTRLLDAHGNEATSALCFQKIFAVERKNVREESSHDAKMFSFFHSGLEESTEEESEETSEDEIPAKKEPPPK